MKFLGNGAMLEIVFFFSLTLYTTHLSTRRRRTVADTGTHLSLYMGGLTSRAGWQQSRQSSLSFYP